MKPVRRRHAALATLAGTGATVTITVVQAFLLIPLCLRFLGTPLYGAWIAATELFVWIQLLDMGIPNLLTQRVGAAVGRDDDRDAARWASTGLTILAAIGLLLLVAGTLMAPAVAAWARVPADQASVFTACFRIGVVASAVLLLFNGCVGLSRGVQRTAVVNVAQVGGALVGLGSAAALLLAGWGLWALATGLALRSLVSLAGGLVFLVTLPAARGSSWPGPPSMAIARDVAGLAPSMAGASVGYLVANNTEILLVTTMFGPVPAAVYALTRRAFDGLRSLLDSIAWAVYGGFAHLVTAHDRDRARTILDEILSIRVAVACFGAAIVAAVNPAFVTLLFGAENFGGIWLTAAFAVHVVVGGQAFLMNFLYRAAGQVRDGSLLLTVEAVVRVVAMAAALSLTGLAGGPWAAAAVSLIAMGVTAGRLDRALPPSATRRPGPRPGLAEFVSAGVLLGGILIGAVWTPPSWSQVALTAALVAVVAGLLLWFALLIRGGADTLVRWTRP